MVTLSEGRSFISTYFMSWVWCQNNTLMFDMDSASAQKLQMREFFSSTWKQEGTKALHEAPQSRQYSSLRQCFGLSTKAAKYATPNLWIRWRTLYWNIKRTPNNYLLKKKSTTLRPGGVKYNLKKYSIRIRPGVGKVWHQAFTLKRVL